MPNRKEPRLEIEEAQPAAKAKPEMNQPETDTPKASKGHINNGPSTSKINNGPSTSKQISSEAASPSQSGSSFKSWLAILLALVTLGLLAWQYL